MIDTIPMHSNAYVGGERIHGKIKFQSIFFDDVVIADFIIINCWLGFRDK
jgi:hypothetical protein